MDKLLAKSPKTRSDGTPKEVTLLEHTRDVVDAANALFGIEHPTRLGKRWLEFFKIPDEWATFHRNLIAACALHDWGKANDTFQNALYRRGEQAIRHEHLSALLMALPEVQQWLISGGFYLPLVLSAVLTHHLKASDKKDGFATQTGGPVFRLVDFGDGFQKLLNYTSDTLRLPSLNASLFPTRWEFGRSPTDVRAHRTRVQDQILEPFRKAIKQDNTRLRLLMAVRSALIASDSAGSGLVRENHTIAEWISCNVTNRNPLTHQEVTRDIIDKRVKQMRNAEKWKDLGDGRSGFTDFQLACDTLPDRALLLAPCGSGKTLAAWRWIAARLKERPAGHALFLYPTRATAREGFKDYVSWAPESDAALMHGTSGFDLEGMFQNPDMSDDRDGRNYVAERRLFSLGYWSKRAFSATVDQFLAFMQYGYGPMCMLPVLVDSVIVIDEVHSFDCNMFSALKDFLKNFDVPVLCMTATLPRDRLNQLVEECGLSAPQKWPEDLQKVAELPRYRLRIVANRTEAEDRVRQALASGKRVLWVVNQVKRAHAILRSFLPNFDPDTKQTDLRTSDGVPVICYHSRFRLSDRVDRHADTMNYLKVDGMSAALGVTTQVCEMSLDIDVDLLVTEECPVTSLIQRMGRCNRQTDARALDDSGEVLVYPPDDGNLPYEPNDLAGLKDFLALVNGQDLNQADLDTNLRRVPCPNPLGDALSRFLESGPYAVGPKDDDGEGFREGNDFNRQCVLLNDIDSFKATSRDQQPGFILPVPNGKVLKREQAVDAYDGLPSYLGVAPDANYHPAVGFCDFPLTDWSAV